MQMFCRDPNQDMSDCLALVMCWLGLETYDLICTLVSPLEPEVKSFEEIVKIVQDHVKPPSSKIVSRSSFILCAGGVEESVSSFVVRLRQAAQDCCSLSDDVTFANALQEALAMASAQSNSENIKAAAAASNASVSGASGICEVRQVKRSFIMVTASVKLHSLRRALAGDSTTTCRGLIIHLDASPPNTTTTILRLLERAELWQVPETWLVVLGGRKGVKTVLLHHSLRNTINGLYLALHQRHYRRANTTLPGRRITLRIAWASGWKHRVTIHRRCLYCKQGNAGVQRVGRWSSSRANLDALFLNQEDHFRSLNGHHFNIVSTRYIPYVDYQKDNEQSDATLTLTHSMDEYNLSELSKKLNFSYTIREEPEGSWGRKGANGSFTGMMGQLQRQEVDFCTLCGVWGGVVVAVVLWGTAMATFNSVLSQAMPARSLNFNKSLFLGWGTLLEQSVAYLPVNVSKRSIPRRQEVTSEETKGRGNLWSYTDDTSRRGSCISTIITSTSNTSIFNTNNKTSGASSRTSGTSSRDGSASTMAILPAQEPEPVAPAPKTPAAVAGPPSILPPRSRGVEAATELEQLFMVLVSVWLTFSLIVVSAYKSSLIANLSIQGKGSTPETLADLIEARDWKWATEDWVFKGYPYVYFSKHQHPVVKKVYQEMKIIPADEALKEVMKGHFSLVHYEQYITIYIRAHFTDTRGRSPFQISKKAISIMAAYGWGVR
ncbi:hypothetical protein O3P69_011133 [Scylla paramamosain]|uniref:Ionotropic glutamate receptor L-glutamate and glycine-binding domain-containing protein n=1 Tax=Scylla paramamosain TaxID=85552 RepID=A0AAW0SUJ9_SCYPA